MAPRQSQATSVPPDVIPLTLSHGAVAAADSSLVVIDAIHASAMASPKASAAGALVLGFSTSGGAAESMFDLRLGQLKYSRLLACARKKLWWMTPEWRAAGNGTITPETQFLLLELAEGKGPYALLLPLIDGSFRATLRPVKPAERPANGEVCLRIESGDRAVVSNKWHSALYVAAGWDPYELVERGVAAAAQLSGGAKRRVDKVLPPLVDNFGWCTWDAFYSTVSARGLQQGLQSLHDCGVRPGFLIIDDGWQMTDVDPSEMPSASELARRLKLPRAQELLEDAEGAFYSEAQQVLGEAAKRIIPPASNAGRLLQPNAENMGPAFPHHHSHGPSHVPKASDKLTAPGAKPASADVQKASAAHGVATPAADGHTAAAVADRDGSSDPLVVPHASGSTAELEIIADRNATKAAAGPAKASTIKSKASDLAEREAIWLVRMAQKAAGALAGAASAAFIVFYQWVVEPAAPDSYVIKWFTATARGPLRGALLSFLATSTDFTRRLTSVKANGKFSSPDAGPDADWEEREERLGDVVAAVKSKFGVKHVYCWHGLPAYWAGVMPGAPGVLQYRARIAFAEPTPGVLEIEPSMAWGTAVIAGIGMVDDPSAVYNDMHAYLAASNVDGVKVDCQAGVGLMGSQHGGGPALAGRFQKALEASVATHFADNHCINCMCHSTENIYRMQDTVLARVSDDFYPRDPASSTPHIAACAYNGVFLSPLLHPDWDMFHSRHPAARLHAMARVISGGAIYVSDKPGEHDLSLLRSLVLPDGSVLRALQPGRPTRDCLFTDVLRDGRSLLKICNVNACSAVVGVFHLQGSSWDRTKRKFFVHNKAPKPLQGRVAPLDVEPWRQAREAASRATQEGKAAAGPQRYVAFSFTTGELSLLGFEDGLPVSLAAACSDLVTLVPLIMVDSGDAGDAAVSFAPVGLVDMMNSGGAITSCSPVGPADGAVAGHEASAKAKGRSYAVGVRGCGQLLLYASTKPQRLTLAGQQAVFSYDPASGKVLVDVPHSESLTHELLVTF